MSFLNKLTIRTKLFGATAGALLAILVLSGTAIYGNRQSSEVLHGIVDNSMNPLLALNEIDGIMRDVRFRLAGVLLDQMPAPGSRQHAKDAQEKIPKLWAEVRANQAAADQQTAEEKELLTKLDKAFAELPAFLTKIQSTYSSSDDKKQLAEILEDEWPQITVKLTKPLDKFVEIRRLAVLDAERRAFALTQRLDQLVLIISVVMVVIMLLGAFFVVRSITQSVKAFSQTMNQVGQGDFTVRAEIAGDDELAQMGRVLNTTLGQLSSSMNAVLHSSNQISLAAQQLSSNANTARVSSDAQTDEIMKISAGMEELTVSIAEVSSGAARVLDSASQAKQLAEDSWQLMDLTRGASSRAMTAAATSSGVVSELSGSVQRITEITAVIKEIADQTNLLALNAAIEAARAGESGRGFAVVADEVRKLAERTTRSTTDIGEMVKAIQAKTGNAVTAMQQVDRDVKEGAGNIEKLGESLQEIVNSSGAVTTQATDISNAMQEQKIVAEQTAQSMEAISQRVEHTSGAVSEVSTTATQAAGIAQVLEASMRHFKL